jgi:ureidoacrylate peracid hydrolase
MWTDLKDIVKPEHTALIIVDMQKDFCVEGFRCVEAGRDIRSVQRIIPTLCQLLNAARQKEVLVIHVCWLTLPDHLSDSGPWLAQRRRSTYSSEFVAIEGTEGGEVIEELAPVKGEVIILKHRYSGFTSTNLDLVLRSNSIRSLIITGLSTNICVESTLRDAVELDYYVVLPKDCTASWSEKLYESTLENVKHRFGHVCTLIDILHIWGVELSMNL